MDGRIDRLVGEWKNPLIGWWMEESIDWLVDGRIDRLFSGWKNRLISWWMEESID